MPAGSARSERVHCHDNKKSGAHQQAQDQSHKPPLLGDLAIQILYDLAFFRR